MKIAILIPTIKPGGAEKQAALLAAMYSEEHEVHFVSLYGKRNLSVIVQQYLEAANVQIHFLSGKRFSKWKEFYQLLKHYKIEVAFNYLTACDVTGAIVEKLAGVTTVFNGIRNSRLAPAKAVMEWFAHNLVADFTIYNCHSGAEYFERLGFCKIKTIVTVGRFEPQKDYLTAIKAITELRKTRKDFVFTIIGHGHLEAQIRQWMKEYGLTDFTQILIAPSNVQDILKAADIYLSTSLFEGTSNSIMEAMNWGIPVVATNVGDNFVLVEQNISGYLTPIGDVDGLVRGLSALLSSYQTRMLMGQKGHEKLHNFSPEKFKNNYYEILKTKI